MQFSAFHPRVKSAPNRLIPAASLADMDGVPVGAAAIAAASNLAAARRLFLPVGAAVTPAHGLALPDAVGSTAVLPANHSGVSTASQT